MERGGRASISGWASGGLMPIRAVLLGFEGLLFDSRASCLQAAVEFKRENGKIWTERDPSAFVLGDSQAI